MVEIHAMAHDIAVANTDGVTIYYNIINDNELEVTRKDGSFNNHYNGVVAIPREVSYNGVTREVTSIGSSAFYKDYVTNVTIPNTVTKIGSNAFENCSSLAEIVIPNSVTDIGSLAFHKSLWYNNQPDGLVYAGKVAYFYKGEMPSNTTITIKDGTVGISNAFYYYWNISCTNLVEIIIPNTVEVIGDCAFYGCTGLSSITIPNSVKVIGASSFYGCKSLKSIVIPESVTTLGDNVFEGCTSLTNVIIPNSVTSIGQAAFWGCSGLTSMTVPSSVTTIGASTFRDCI